MDVGCFHFPAGEAVASAQHSAAISSRAGRSNPIASRLIDQHSRSFKTPAARRARQSTAIDDSITGSESTPFKRWRQSNDPTPIVNRLSFEWLPSNAHSEITAARKPNKQGNTLWLRIASQRHARQLSISRNKWGNSKRGNDNETCFWTSKFGCTIETDSTIECKTRKKRRRRRRRQWWKKPKKWPRLTIHLQMLLFFSRCLFTNRGRLMAVLYHRHPFSWRHRICHESKTPVNQLNSGAPEHRSAGSPKVIRNRRPLTWRIAVVISNKRLWLIGTFRSNNASHAPAIA